MIKLILIIIVLLNVTTMAYATPNLQLDIANGIYNPKSTVFGYNPAINAETIVATDNSFTLYALMKEFDKKTSLSDTFYISVALTPQTSPDGLGNGGSFIFDGNTINVSNTDMVYGVPPIETNLLHDPQDLSTHDIFLTYFKEIAFKFDPAKTISEYNTQDRAISGGAIPLEGSGLYWMAFDVDISSLASGYGIHFDLYSELARTGKCAGDIDVNQFAPYSHDAEGTYTPVPEPGTMMLLGVGIFGLAVFGKRRMNKAS